MDDRFGKFFTVLLGAVVAFGFAGVIFLVGDSFGVCRESVDVVIAKQFMPAISSTGTGLSSSGDLVVTNSYSPEQWLVILENGGRPLPVSINRYSWAICEKGTKVGVKWTEGRWSGRASGVHIATIYSKDSP